MTGSPRHAGRVPERLDALGRPDDAPTDTFPVVGGGPRPDDRPTDVMPRVDGPAPTRDASADAGGAATDPDARAATTGRIDPAVRNDATGRTDGVDGDDPADGDDRPTQTLLQQMGGIPGVVYSTVPVAVFIVVNILTSLRPAIFAALGVAVAIAIVRVVRKEALQPAISGLIGVAVCAFIANRSGEARDFYLPGLLLSAGLGLACLVSIVVRWPLAGVIWHGINGEGQAWRADRRLLRAYMFATGLWTLVFAARVVVQGWLYKVDEADWLGVARLLMGYPLMGVALLGTVLAVRHARSGQPTAEKA